MSGRILVIRGGAIGDFILTLPALALLRDAFPSAHIEILGYRHIVALAEGRYYADESRCIEYAPLAGFFNPRSELDPELCSYFAGFHQVVSYLFDPDEFFQSNLHRAGVRNLLVGDPRIGDHLHAAHQLSAPLQRLGLFLEDPAAQFFPSDLDLNLARDLLPREAHPAIALHPGSGSERKNWPIARWSQLLDHLLAVSPPNAHFFLVGGEADRARLDQLRPTHPHSRIQFVVDLPLPVLGALLTLCDAYFGHDSGISHLAAATGCPSLLLFGPTDPAIWSPQNPGVRVLAAATGNLADIKLETVATAADSLLQDVLSGEPKNSRN